jgi:hypothetical protein
MTRINLLPESYFAARRRRRLGWLSAAAGLAVLAAASAGWWFTGKQLDALSAGVVLAENKLTIQEKQQAAAARMEAERDALRGVLAVRRKVELPLPASSALLLPCNMVPPSIVLTRCSVEVPGATEAERTPPSAGAAATAGAGAASVAQPMRLELEGLGLNDVEVTRFVSTVSNHRVMRNVKLSKSRSVTVAGLSRTYFVLELQIPLNAEFVSKGRKDERP